MRLFLLATTGGALGAGARYLVNVWTLRLLGGHFPWATFAVNVVGSLLMGMVVEIVAQRFNGSAEVRVFLATGVLGGFTTFSAFSHDAVTLLDRGDLGLAVFYIVGSVVVSIGMLYLGLAIARHLFG